MTYSSDLLRISCLTLDCSIFAIYPGKILQLIFNNLKMDAVDMNPRTLKCEGKIRYIILHTEVDISCLSGLVSPI